jgi:hypothetical protein
MKIRAEGHEVDENYKKLNDDRHGIIKRPKNGKAQFKHPNSNCRAKEIRAP